MRPFALLLCAAFPCLLSAQFFTDSVTIVDRSTRDGGFRFVVPTGQEDPQLFTSSDGDIVLISIGDDTTITTDTLLSSTFLNEVQRYEDLNGDGFPDLISRLGRIYYGTADGGLETTPVVGFGNILDYADWDGDGLTDVFHYRAPGTFSGAGAMLVGRHVAGTRTIEIDTLDATIGERGDGGLVDLNNDGVTDFCFIGGDFPNTALVCAINDGTGGFTLTRVTDNNVRGSALITGDFNGDGFGDIIHEASFTGINLRLSNAGSLEGSTVRNVYNGDPEYYLGPGGSGDFDDDGDLDFVALLKQLNEENVDIGVFLNDGTGSFAAPQIIGSYRSFRSANNFEFQNDRQRLRYTDLNGDGREDILVNDADRGEVSYVYFSTAAPNSLPAEVVTAEDARVFPNPTDGRDLRVDLPGDRRIVSALLVDAAGRLLERRPAADARSVRVNDLPAGMYTLVVTDDRSVIYRARFFRK